MADNEVARHKELIEQGQKMAQRQAKTNRAIEGLDKMPQVVYDMKQEGCAGNRYALTVPQQSQSSKEDTMTTFARYAALAILGCSAIAIAPAPAEARSVDCRRVPQHLWAQVGCHRSHPMAVIRPLAHRGPAIYVKPGIGGGAAVASRPAQDMNPEKLAQLKALLGERAQALFGEGPEGATYHGYQKVPGASINNPCKPGYEPIKQEKDSQTGRTFVRCYRPDSD